MAGSLNKVIIIGNVGQDPDIKTFQDGGKSCNLSIATSESWKDKATGEKKERTEWHRVVVRNDGLIKVIESYVKKGDKLYIEGQLETRSWEKDGSKRYTTEIVLRPYRGELTMLSSRNNGGSQDQYQQDAINAQQSNDGPVDDFEEDIPF